MRSAARLSVASAAAAKAASRNPSAASTWLLGKSGHRAAILRSETPLIPHRRARERMKPAAHNASARQCAGGPSPVLTPGARRHNRARKPGLTEVETGLPAHSWRGFGSPLRERGLARRADGWPLVQALASPAVAASPKRARRTGGPFVIDTFFMWTAYNSVCHHDGPGPGRLDEPEHFFRNADIVADVGPFGEPSSEVCDVSILSRHDADRKLGGCSVVWAVERDSRHRVATKSSPGSFAEPFACALEHVLVIARQRL